MSHYLYYEYTNFTLYKIYVVSNAGWVNNEITSKSMELESTNTKFLLSITKQMSEGSTLEYYVVDEESGIETPIIPDQITKIQTTSTKVHVKIVGTKGIDNKLPTITNIELKSV